MHRGRIKARCPKQQEQEQQQEQREQEQEQEAKVSLIAEKAQKLAATQERLKTTKNPVMRKKIKKDVERLERELEELKKNE